MPKLKDCQEHPCGVRKIRVEDAVGLHLAHDITEIRAGEFKGPAFRKGHKVEEQDLCHLLRLGKRHLYVLDLDQEHVHEDEAALILAQALAGPGVAPLGRPKEGKLQMEAAWHGLFKVNVDVLVDFNLMPDMMCATIHTDTPVRAGQRLAGTRIIPLLVHRRTLEEAQSLTETHYPILLRIPSHSHCSNHMTILPQSSSPVEALDQRKEQSTAAPTLERKSMPSRIHSGYKGRKLTCPLFQFSR